MVPNTYDLLMHRGDTATWQFRIWEDAPGGTPFDLTGAAVAAEIRDQPGGTLLTTMTCTVTLPNIVDVVFPPSAWATFPASGAWDLELDFGAGTEVETVLRGKVIVQTYTAAVFDLNLYHEDSAAWLVKLWHDAAHTIPVDLTGSLVVAEIRDPTGAGVVPLGVHVHDLNEIDVTINMPSWPSIPLAGLWNLTITDPGGVIRTVLTGKVKVTMDVTHST